MVFSDFDKQRVGALGFVMCTLTLVACPFDEGDVLMRTIEKTQQAPVHPDIVVDGQTYEQEPATDAWVPPSMWQAVVRAFVPMQMPELALDAVATWAKICRQTHGDWHDAWVRCRCADAQIFDPVHGCIAAPPLWMTDSDCPEDFLHAPSRCLRSLQSGALAWHLAFHRHRSLLRVLQRQQTAYTWPKWWQNTAAHPASDAQISLHVSNQPERHKASLARWSQDDFTLEPAQYTQILTVFAEDVSMPWPTDDALACAQRLATITSLPQVGRAILCESAHDTLLQLQKLSDCFTPKHVTGQRRAKRQALPSYFWLETEAMLETPELAPAWLLHVEQIPRQRHADANLKIFWRVHIREQIVLARHLRVMWQPDAQERAWDLRVYVDGAGQVQAWSLWAPEHGCAKESWVWHGRALRGRSTLKPSG